MMHTATARKRYRADSVGTYINIKRGDWVTANVIRLILMPHSGSKLSSAFISEALFRQYIDALQPLFTELYDGQLLTVSYGWACNLHADLLFVPMRVPVETFAYFMLDSIEQHIYEVGRSDLLITNPNKDVLITLCHESDIHLDGDNDPILARLVGIVPAIEFKTACQWSDRTDRPGFKPL